ncbi:putative disease resistance RPP13-like protein 1 [Lotus japonicus]|uniref:putative disease resistance RPP13-like protein 1 n=1 Tax=Lotus japonicus TaxID=34305 RepID=UPI00258504B7|nr:putative disease resistance RPP13-like protein 1 [Lotus japonicus]
MAVEFVGSALLSASLEVAFERLASAEIVDYFQGRKLNKKLLNKLNIMLLSINSVVDDAEQRQIRNPHVKAWLDAVKDAVFEAEDLMDEIDTKASQCNLEAESQSSTSKVWNFFNAAVSSFDKEIESRMQEILDSLEYLASQKDILGLKEAGGSGVGLGSQMSQKLPSTSLLGETVMYGRDVDKEIILNWLMLDIENHNHQQSIISIVGMGGMGKTTLAQHLYNDQRMEIKFDIKAWVCVSDEFDVFRVTRMIFEAITESVDDSRDLNMVQGRLKEKLYGKRFLIILDDVWNENYMQWETLQTPFNYGAQGSKILVTTRSVKVASTMRSANIHQLEQLKEEHCWALFAKYAFRHGSPQLNPELKETGIEIIRKCKGLPLALKTVGSLLYTKSSFLEWKNILTSEIWDLPEEDSNIIPALRLSYHHLPSHLKRCFAYCSLFPKDYVFEKDHLVLLWLAENFLQCRQKTKSMEEVGEEYFDDLLSRSFFQQSSGDEMKFVMHDLLNDLAKYVCGDFVYRLEVEEAQKMSNKTRHFSYLRNRYESSKRFEDLQNANRLRTFLPLDKFPKVPFHDHFWMSSKLMDVLISKFKLLRVLSLSCYYNGMVVPDTIGSLKHLCYLDLSHTNIEKLPDSTCLLYNLQILKLKNCRYLKELPLNLHKLTNLRYLDFSGTQVRKMPMHFGKLKNLQVLNSFFVGQGSEYNIQQLDELNLQGTLSISELQNIINPLDALEANLKNKIRLVKLDLEWSADLDDSQNAREVLEKLQPSKHLKELSILNYGGTRFPNWFGDNSLSNMVSLKLRNCQNCFLLPPLGLLPSLRELLIIELTGTMVIGSEFYGNGSSSSSTAPFASLETLKFQDMYEWEEWECKLIPGAFPRLQKLSIKNCPNLKEHLPEKLPCLITLEIFDCMELVSLIPLAPSIHELEINNCGKLQIDYLPSTLKILKIGGCCMEGSFLEKIEQTISDTSLEKMHIIDCPNMKLPLFHGYNFLVELSIRSSCDSLRNFPLNFFPKLHSLRLGECCNFEMISQEHSHDLKFLLITRCSKFVSFPEGGFSAPGLVFCHLHKLENLKSLPECMHTLLPSLVGLIIQDCPELELFPDGGLPSSLKYLYLRNCAKLMASLKRALRTTTSLLTLYIGEMDSVESFPDEGLLPHSLTSVSITWCPNLKKLDYMGLCRPSSLTRLYLSNCPRLQCLPEEGLPKSISTLQFWGDCLLLKKRCQKPNGEDWGKISHIQCIIIDSDIIT